MKVREMDSVTLPSYAKINLGLVLVGKRRDGYHDIVTVFQQINLHDTLSFTKTSGDIFITSSDPGLPVGEDNLVWRAFSLYKDRAGIRDGVQVHIEKRIPSGGGLGGGSSNAAVTLQAANRLWGDRFTPDELNEMAVALGSDVPFFLVGGTAYGQGRGEILESLDWPVDWVVVLLCPGIHVSTPWVYQNTKISLTKDKIITNFNAVLRHYNDHALQLSLVNDLEGVVFQRHPLLKELKEQLAVRGAFYASMSGSGSSVFGLFRDKRKADSALSFFSDKYKISAMQCHPISMLMTDEDRH